MFGLLARFTRWLHTQWPAGTVEKLPAVNADGSTNVRGVYVVGDLTGIPLLKFSADSGARAVQAIVADSAFRKLAADAPADLHDVVIVGAGIAGMAAALEARKSGLKYAVLEATEPFSTIVNFPARKPIYTYPTDMTPAGELQFTAQVKEPLVAEIRAQTLEAGIVPWMARAERVQRAGQQLEVVIPDGANLRAQRVIVAIGRSGNFRKLGVPGEERSKVVNRLHDPRDFRGQDVLVVGGGDSAVETAVACAQNGARVTFSYRGADLSRPKPENVARLHAVAADASADVEVGTPSSDRVTSATGRWMPKDLGAKGSLEILLGSQVTAIGERHATLVGADRQPRTIPNDAVFTMLGREAPLEFFRRSGIALRGELPLLKLSGWLGLALFMLFCVFLYNWKTWGSAVNNDFRHEPNAPGLLREEPADWNAREPLFPYGFVSTAAGWFGDAAKDKTTLIGTLAKSFSDPGIWYALAYCVCVTVFGIRRMRRRRTPYVRAQTWTLILVQVIPLFLLPYIVLPYLGHNGAFADGVGRTIAENFFWSGYGTNAWDYESYWRVVGLILAWPLFLWNVFTPAPMWGWLIVSLVQTFVIIPLIVWKWGKGAYCGWICSCGALAETMGDAHRHKMPHGPGWNRLNMVGQGVLALALGLFALRVVSWISPGGWAASSYAWLLESGSVFGVQTNYKWVVDIFLAGILGVGLYFWFSGRVWCRFACPLAALMHLYARFSKFRIFAEKKKCISCNVCTSVCHQGIDVMNFANKGIPMADPQCVRCSACVQSCPTGVLNFGEIGRGGTASLDRLPASIVQLAEMKK